MILPSRHYCRDPLDTLIEKERHETPCKGCKFDRGIQVFDARTIDCSKGRKKRNSKCYEDTFGITCQGGK